MGDHASAKVKTGLRVIKEGFLVKKGHRRRNWRTRWFVLQRDTLSYYNSRGDATPIDTILLEGCSVRKPSEELLRHPHLFELLTPAGRLYQLEAANADDLNNWTAGIAKATQSFTALRRHVSVKQRHISVSQHLFVDTTSAELLQAMQDEEAGLRLSERRFSSGTVEVCFAGCQLVDWLLDWSFSESRRSGAQIGLSLLNGGYIQPVDDSLLLSEEFCDSDRAFYRFSAFRVGGESSSPFNDTDSVSPSEDGSGSDSSSDETVGCVPVFRTVGHSDAFKATVIKQGILSKKGHKRRNWKARRFVLLSNGLYYFRASKPKSEPVGFIPLKEASVKVFEAEETPGPRRMYRSNSAGVLQTQQSGALFVVTTGKGVAYLLQASTDQECVEWREAIQSTISDMK